MVVFRLIDLIVKLYNIIEVVTILWSIKYLDFCLLHFIVLL